MGVEPRECLFVGDSAVDVETAVNAGMRSMGVLWGFRDELELRAAGAEVIVREAGEVLDWVNGGR